MLGLTFSFKLHWALTLSLVLKLPPKNLELLIWSMNFLSLKVALYLCKYTNWPCMEYCCHVWACAPSRYLELLGKLQKWICGFVGPCLATSLEPLAHLQNVASLSITLLDIHLNWLICSHFLILKKGLLIILIDSIILLSSFLGVTRMSMSIVSLLILCL